MPTLFDNLFWLVFVGIAGYFIFRMLLTAHHAHERPMGTALNPNLG